MKKGIYLFAAIALMASCSQEEVFVDTPEANPDVPRLIGFETFVDKATRADANNSNALDFFYPTFNVYGWKVVGNESPYCVFNNIPVEFFTEDAQGTVVYKDENQKPSNEWTFEANNWYYENIRYWDKLATSYQFSAYAPADASASVNCQPDGIITIGTDTAPISVDCENLMATPTEKLAYKGFALDYMTATSKVATSPVSLIFKHLQAKLNILVKLDDEVTTAQNVAIQKIKVHNLGNKAYYTNVEGVGVSGWKLGEADADYVPSITEVEGGYSLNNATANFNKHYVLEQLIIPQTLAKYVGEEVNSLNEYTQACVYVEYTIGDETFKSFTPLANIFSNAETYNFEGGKQYTINITVGPKPIYFTAEVAPWADAIGDDLIMD
jgi:hypothetical protein